MLKHRKQKFGPSSFVTEYMMDKSLYILITFIMHE